MPKKGRTSSLENIFVSDAHRVIYNEISYLKRRIHLVEGERKANYESNEEILKNNEQKLKEVKEKNQTLREERKKILQSKEIFLREISIKLGGEKKAYEFKDKKFDDVVDILECKIGTLRNKQNYLKYTKAQQAKLMEDVLQEEQMLQKMMEGKRVKSQRCQVPKAVRKRLTEIKSTETAIAAMMMKITEADNIRSRYKNMTALLKHENLALNKKVIDADSTMTSDKVEIDRIRNVLHESLKARKAAKARLTEVEETTIKDYSSREQALYEARLKLKTIAEKMDQLGSKLSFPKFQIIHRDSSVTDGLFVGYHPTDDKVGGKLQTVAEMVYSELAQMIGESDATLIVTRFQEQRDHSKELLVQDQAAKSAVRKIKLRKRFLLDKLLQLQYSGGLTREKLDHDLAVLNHKISSLKEELEAMRKWDENHSAAADQMLHKLEEICKSNEFKSQPFHPNSTPAENVVQLLKFLLQQVEKILASGIMDGIVLPSEPSPTAEVESPGLNIPFEITAEGPTFGLPSPVGSTTSFRFASGSDLDFSEFRPTSERDRDRAPSIIIEGSSATTPKLDFLDMQLPDLVPSPGGKDTERGKLKPISPGRKGESSEEEEPVTRTVVKRQSQILYEARTRKGRFNQPGGGHASPSPGARGHKY